MYTCWNNVFDGNKKEFIGGGKVRYTIDLDEISIVAIVDDYGYVLANKKISVSVLDYVANEVYSLEVKYCSKCHSVYPVEIEHKCKKKKEQI